MSECLNASLVEMTANHHHIHPHTNARFKYCLAYLNTALRWERRPLFSHLNQQFCRHIEPSPRHTFTLYQLPSLLLYLLPPSSAFIFPFMTFPISIPLSQRFLSHISHHPCSFLPFTGLVLTPTQPGFPLPCFSLYPLHYPVSFLLPLHISSSLWFGPGSLPIPHSSAHLSLFSSQTSLDGHSTW